MTPPDLESRAEPGGLTGAFWKAAAAGRLVRPVCNACGHSFFTPRWSCPACHSEDWSYQESSGRGRVYSHTVVHRGPDTSWDVPYILAIIDLDEGWTMLSRLVGMDPVTLDPRAVAGTAVRVQFEPEQRPPHRVLPVFAPTGGPA